MDPREAALNDVARRIMIQANYDPHFSGIEERVLMETKLFLARYDAMVLFNHRERPVGKHPALAAPYGGDNIYEALAAELEKRLTVYTVGEVRSAPIDMILFCPNCGLQHIDAAESHTISCPASVFRPPGNECTCDRWTNPPHKSHLCGYCNHVFRPADVPTNGVLAIQTVGENDSLPPIRQVKPLDRFLPKWLHKGSTYRELGRGELQVSGHLVQLTEGARLVAYQGEDNRIWFRLEMEFEDGRFEKL